MSKEEYYIDDRFEIPEHIKNMTHDERQREIERLEAEKKRQLDVPKIMPKAV